MNLKTKKVELKTTKQTEDEARYRRAPISSNVPARVRDSRRGGAAAAGRPVPRVLRGEGREADPEGRAHGPRHRAGGQERPDQVHHRKRHAHASSSPTSTSASWARSRTSKSPGTRCVTSSSAHRRGRCTRGSGVSPRGSARGFNATDQHGNVSFFVFPAVVPHFVPYWCDMRRGTDPAGSRVERKKKKSRGRKSSHDASNLDSFRVARRRVRRWCKPRRPWRSGSTTRPARTATRWRARSRSPRLRISRATRPRDSAPLNTRCRTETRTRSASPRRWRRPCACRASSGSRGARRRRRARCLPCARRRCASRARGPSAARASPSARRWGARPS